MNIFEKALSLTHDLANDKIVEESIEDYLLDFISALLGNPISVAKLIIKFEHTPLFLRDRLFWIKFQKFLNGVYTCESDYIKLKAKLGEYVNSDEGAQRLIECIDRADTNNKIQFLINVTTRFVNNKIDGTTYFRICHAVTHTLEEDLQFLKEHISERELTDSMNVQGLITTGLMIMVFSNRDGGSLYSFTELANKINQYAIKPVVNKGKS